MAAPLLAVSAASSAASSPALRWLLAAVVTGPALLVVLLVLLVGGGLAAAADSCVGVPGTLRPGAVPAGYEPLLLRAAGTCPGITAQLLAAQLKAESGWNPRALRPVGAQGLAQFTPGTWDGEGFDGDGDGVRDPFAPADAIASQAVLCASCLRRSPPMTA